MKTIQTIILSILLIPFVQAAEPKTDAPKSKTLLENISVSPYATVVNDGIEDGESYGAGVALSLGINKFASIELTATTYSDNDWRDEAIDETAVLGKFRLVKNASETFSLYGIAGGDRDWGRDDWALSVGAGVQLRVHERVSLFADSRLRAWLSGNDGKNKDLATRAGIGFNF